ncbi:AAA family ATPase [Jannaschia formosa]|uniref:AAA family ATPase n=1 Tax=Jannaschia formosa TaxID=2259592 RepID=UPI000E1BA25C|nr:MoxR family ATPase [Jannaschia formosa]TFL16044.1 AAA family ATPase [Jannaschia formosa]
MPLLAGADDPALYDADPELLEAASVAILLGQPLLLTGEPGCGKSTFADHITWRLKRGLRALRVDGRSNMELRDLFYTYDDVGRFRDRDGDERPAAYLTLQGLGEAILRGSDPEKTADLRNALLGNRNGEGARCDPIAPSRDVVLFDEIDKAPRDVPNDLLGRLTGERVSFQIPELNTGGGAPVEIVAQSEHQPIIICTSNSERSLPDAFLRRCVYHHIETPTGARLRRIIEMRVFRGSQPSDALFRSVEVLFAAIRERSPRKKPGLAELISFVMLLREEGWKADDELTGTRWKPLAALTLLKTQEDRQNAEYLLNISA